MPKMTDDELALFLVGWLAGLCRSDDCPIHVDHVDSRSTAHLSGGAHHNVVINKPNPDGSYDHHFDVVTRSGVKMRVTVEVIE